MNRANRILLSIALVATAAVVPAQLPRNNVRFLSQIPLSGFPGSPASGSGCAGYVSPSGKEYAIMGLRNGNAVVDITNPSKPMIVEHIPGVSSQWHEVCVLGDYAYACTEGGGGIQIIDLRQVDQGIVTLAATYTGNSVSTGHTIQAIPGSKLVMINGGNMGSVNGLRALDCQNPTQPVQVGTWTTKYVHDTVYKTYTSGPYAGKTICFAFCGSGATGGMYIIDVTTTPNGQGQNVPAMQTLGFIRYFPNATNFYSHSGSVSPDGRYVYVNDEFDEGNSLVTDCTTHIIDVQNLSSPVYAGSFNNPINAIDHNSMVQDGFLFLAAYKSGLRVYDLSNPIQLRETGFFDTYSGSGFQYQGAWGTWAGFPSGNVIISDINAGLFVVDPSEAKGWGAPITNIAYTGIVDPGDGNKLLRRFDDQALQLDFANPTGSAKVTYVTDSQARNVVDVFLKARSLTGKFEVIRIYAKDVTNGNERLIGSYKLTTSYTAFKMTNLAGANLINSKSAIQLTIHLTNGAGGTGSVEVDALQVSVHN